ncbi:phage protein Gp27 family protein [Rhodopseudomonas parapalustris]
MANRPSSIDRLPEEVRDLIGRLRDQGCTIDEIMLKLGELDLDKKELPSRSALGRHLQKAAEIAERVKKSRQVAEVIVRRLGETDPDKTTRMNLELMHNILFEIATRTSEETGEPVSFSFGPMEAMLLAKAMDRIREGDVALRSDLHKLRKVASATGAPRFVAERDDDHADRTWAAFLGIHAAGDGVPDYDGYQSARPEADRTQLFEQTSGGRALW